MEFFLADEGISKENKAWARLKMKGNNQTDNVATMKNEAENLDQQLSPSTIDTAPPIVVAFRRLKIQPETDNQQSTTVANIDTMNHWWRMSNH